VAVLVNYKITRLSNSSALSVNDGLVLVNYKITRLSNCRPRLSLHFRVLVNYKITRLSNRPNLWQVLFWF